MTAAPWLPLDGLKVVDLSQGVAGPHCGMLFAQYGADVVKVEPLAGDWGRAIGRQYEDFSAYFAAFNRGKRSLAADLKSAAGAAAVRALLADADVVIENYRPGVLERLGFGYDRVSADNPEVVFVSITGFGQSGPRASMPATDSILQSYSGLMSVNRDGNGLPQRIGVLVIDVVTGLYAYQAAATALLARASGQGGRHITTSLMEAIGAVQAGKMIEFQLEGADGVKPGVPVGTFATADGYVTINARRDQHFTALCELLGLDDLARDTRLRDSAGRTQHEAEIMPALAERLAAWSRDALVEELARLDILHACVNDYAQYFDDPHVRETSAVQWLELGDLGEVPLPRIPGVSPVDAGDARVNSPRTGQHSRALLLGLGWSDSAVTEALGTGAIKQAEPDAASDA